MRQVNRNVVMSVLLLAIVAPVWGSTWEDGLSAQQVQKIREQMWVNSRNVAHDLSSGSGSGSSYVPSFLPEADVEVIGGISRVDVDHIGPSGFAYDGDLTALHGGVQITQDRWRVRSYAHYTWVEGKGAISSGVDTEDTGLTFMPGYRFFTQEEAGVNLDVDGILDLTYTTHKGAGGQPSAWYFRPGVRAAVNRMTTAGLFQVTGTYQSRRNIDGDTAYTGNANTDAYGLAFDYACPLTEFLFANVGLSYIELLDTPAGPMDEDFTDLNVRVGSLGNSRFRCSGGFFTAIDGRNSTGVDFRAVFGL